MTDRLNILRSCKDPPTPVRSTRGLALAHLFECHSRGLKEAAPEPQSAPLKYGMGVTVSSPSPCERPLAWIISYTKFETAVNEKIHHIWYFSKSNTTIYCANALALVHSETCTRVYIVLCGQPLQDRNRRGAESGEPSRESLFMKLKPCPRNIIGVSVESRRHGRCDRGAPCTGARTPGVRFHPQSGWHHEAPWRGTRQ